MIAILSHVLKTINNIIFDVACKYASVACYETHI